MTDSSSQTRRDPAKYRPCVGVMLINADSHVFVGQRIDNSKGDFWQMPQGGVDDGEDLAEAMLRELEEETGVKASHAAILGQLEEELYYDLPEELIGKLWGGKFLGQRQAWFLVRFTGEDADIDLNAHKHPEFNAFKWVEPSTLPDLIVPFKRDVYQAIVDGFSGTF